MFIFENPNPVNNLVGDCVIRAISIAMDKPWEETYDELCRQGGLMYDMPSSNEVWSEYLKQNGFKKKVLPNTCPSCYTIRDFCIDHPFGEYLVATGSHLVAVIDGNYYDTWDSGNEIPVYYFKRR